MFGLVSSTQFSPGLLATPAVPCTLHWQASSSPSVVGYALYYGVTGSVATNRVDVGAAQTFTINNLSAFSNYFFFVVAYDAGSLESVPSNVLFYTPPALSWLRIVPLDDGTMSIRFRAATGALCRVQYAATPASAQWVTLGTGTASATGDVAINDPPAGRPAIRFYRGVSP